MRLIAQSVPQVWSQQIEVMYYLESAMTLAIAGLFAVRKYLFCGIRKET